MAISLSIEKLPNHIVTSRFLVVVKHQSGWGFGFCGLWETYFIFFKTVSLEVLNFDLMWNNMDGIFTLNQMWVAESVLGFDLGTFWNLNHRANTATRKEAMIEALGELFIFFRNVISTHTRFLSNWLAQCFSLYVSGRKTEKINLSPATCPSVPTLSISLLGQERLEGV